MLTDLLVNARIDAIVTDIDAVQERLLVTDGEQVVYLTACLAGALKCCGDREVFSAAVGFLLSYVARGGDDRTRGHLWRLLAACDVEQVPGSAGTVPAGSAP